MSRDSTEKQTIGRIDATSSVPIKEGQISSHVTAPSDDEIRQWLKVSLLTRITRAVWRLWLSVSYRFYFNLSVSGLEHVPEKEPLIIVSNHSSHLDAGALIVALKKRSKTIHPMAARDYFFNTRFRFWASLSLLNALPFDRQSHFGECIAFALGVLRHGHSLIYFPEGSRSINGVTQPFKHGIGLLAIKSGVPVLPAYISGTFRSLPKNKWLPLPCHVHVRFGAPVYAGPMISDGSPSDQVARVTTNIQSAVEVLSKQITAPLTGCRS